LRFGEYNIVKYRPEFKQRILELQKHLWGRNKHINASYLEWKYHSNPYADKPLIHVAFYGEQVVGMRGFWATSWEFGLIPRKILCLLGVDVVVDPNHRRRGVLKNMTKVALEELDNSSYKYIIALSANEGSASNVMKLGWQSAGLLYTAQWRKDRDKKGSEGVKVISEKPVLLTLYRNLQKATKFLTRSQHRDSTFYTLDKNSLWHNRKFESNISIEKSPRPKAMAELVHRIGNAGRMRQVRDSQFFQWRFLNPRSAYRFIFWENSNLEGYLILRASAVGKGGITIVDLEATTHDLKGSLIETALKLGNFDSVTIWSATLGDEEKDLLRKIGFRFSTGSENSRGDYYRPNVLITPISHECSKGNWSISDRQLLELANWDLRAIYSDAF